MVEHVGEHQERLLVHLGGHQGRGVERHHSVYRTVTSIKGKITGFFSGARNWLFNSGKSILNGLKDGIMSAIGSVTSAVSGAVSRIRSFFPFSPAKVGPFSGHGYTTFSGKGPLQGWAQGIGSGTGTVVSAISGAMTPRRGCSRRA